MLFHRLAALSSLAVLTLLEQQTAGEGFNDSWVALKIADKVDDMRSI